MPELPLLGTALLRVGRCHVTIVMTSGQPSSFCCASCPFLICDCNRQSSVWLYVGKDRSKMVERAGSGPLKVPPQIQRSITCIPSQRD